jgi:DNA-binding CsgD family transcriptional regulator
MTARQQVHITAAESTVLALLPTHLTVEAIAEQLGRRRNTTKTHIAHIYKKLDAGSRAEAVARARDAGLLPAPDVRAAGTENRRRSSRAPRRGLVAVDE